jgi:hypothetical protein
MGILAAATPAVAQISQATPGQARFAATDTDTTPPPRRSSTPIEFRGQIGGVFRSGDAGFILGGAIGARPFNNKQVEVAGDVSFMRFHGSNGLYWSGNGLYHFKTSDPNFSPYAGAGIGLVSISDDTEARFQILGGLEVKSSSKHPIRPEVRFVFTETDVTTILMVSIGLSKR